MSGYNYIGAKICNCYNKSNISITNTETYSDSIQPHNMVGGIVGHSDNNTEIINCYNSGIIEGYNAYMNLVGGIVGRAYETKIINSYNTKEVIGTSSTYNEVNGILGQGYTQGGIVTITNSYCTTLNTHSYMTTNPNTNYTTGVIEETILKGYASTLGDAYTNDIQDEEGNWIYNNGYPILKWQISK